MKYYVLFMIYKNLQNNKQKVNFEKILIMSVQICIFFKYKINLFVFLLNIL